MYEHKYECLYSSSLPWDGLYFPCYEKLIEKVINPHMIKYTIGWEFDGREPPLIWEMYGY